jgi:HSP20 family protein
MQNKKEDALIKRESNSIVKSNDQLRMVIEPFADLFETSDGFVLRLDMPGALKDTIALSVNPERLSIRAKVYRSTDQDADLIYSEIGPNDYFREFRLGRGIDIDNVIARYEDGIVVINLPKTQELRAKVIKIK